METSRENAMVTRRKAVRKSKMVSLRLTPEQFEYLDNIALKLRQSTGFQVTRASIILKLMEYGFPYLEHAFPELKSTSSIDEQSRAG
jgi:hypothetical protein